MLGKSIEGWENYYLDQYPGFFIFVETNASSCNCLIKKYKFIVFDRINFSEEIKVSGVWNSYARFLCHFRHFLDLNLKYEPRNMWQLP